jgi:hypothetical protein
MVHELKHRIGFKHSRGHLVLAHTGSQRPRDLATQQDHRQARECITACRFIPALTHYGLASRQAVEKIATARPPVTGTERGVSNREGDTRYLCFTTLCQESIPAALSPSPSLTLGLWSPVGSNTETDDDCRRRQFSIGKLSVRKLPLQFNNSRRDRRIRWIKHEKCVESL